MLMLSSSLAGVTSPVVSSFVVDAASLSLVRVCRSQEFHQWEESEDCCNQLQYPDKKDCFFEAITMLVQSLLSVL